MDGPDRRAERQENPAFTLATAPLADAQRDQFREHADAIRRHKESVDHGERGGEPPTCRRCLLRDATLDSVAPVLQANPRGVLLASEELDSWLQSFTRFSGGKATDRPRWLTLYGGRMLVVDRKAGGTIAVGRAAASLCGTIQPGVFSSAMTTETKSSGLTSRILLAMPPRKPRRWSDATVGADTRDRYRGCVLGLLRLDFDPDGEPVPLPLTPEALSYYQLFYNAFGERIDSTLDGDTRAVLGKLEGAALRLALVSELASAADPAATTTVGLEAVQAGVRLAEWFASEADRINGVLGVRDRAKSDRDLVDMVRRRDDSAITPRDLRRWNGRRFPTAEVAEAALDELVSAGVGTWEDRPAGPSGGRPTRRFRITTPPEPA